MFYGWCHLFEKEQKKKRELKFILCDRSHIRVRTLFILYHFCLETSNFRFLWVTASLNPFLSFFCFPLWLYYSSFGSISVTKNVSHRIYHIISQIYKFILGFSCMQKRSLETLFTDLKHHLSKSL